MKSVASGQPHWNWLMQEHPKQQAEGHRDRYDPNDGSGHHARDYRQVLSGEPAGYICHRHRPTKQWHHRKRRFEFQSEVRK
ncbi:hypothetical protein CQ010_15455 [Arthrobacter sp. MYb211]|nr:hypothetical protein CQ019_06995 [Arthrobacter sp. MYb229]PRB51999.1 hypothetical protein CQ013_09585 [Arthrobacter sp. MYb216]PRC05454.1 hypothetical protein CQ010_15455 [Arthrobacter sp. MYb211]